MVDNRIHASAYTALFGGYYLSCEKGNLGGIKTEIGQKVIIDFLYLDAPCRVAVVGLSLMEKNPLDHTVFLCYAGAFQQSFVRCIVISGHECFVPVGFVCYARRIEVFIEMDNVGTTYRHRNNTDPYVFRKIGNQCPAEIIHGGKAGVLAYQRRHGVTPHAFGTRGRRKVDCRQQSEPVRDILSVDRLYGGIPFHVRLSETEIYVKVGIGLRRSPEDACCHGHRYQDM